MRSSSSSSLPESTLLEQSAPAICVEVFAAAVGTDERAYPSTGTAVLLHALEPVAAVRAGQRAAVQMSVGVKVRRGVSGGSSNGTMGSRHLGSPASPGATPVPTTEREKNGLN